MKFIQGDFDPNFVQMYDPNSGSITTSTKDKVQGLERAVVWDALHVEDRLRDHFEGRKNAIVESYRLK